jgi:hypothetical protein
MKITNGPVIVRFLTDGGKGCGNIADYQIHKPTKNLIIKFRTNLLRIVHFREIFNFFAYSFHRTIINCTYYLLHSKNFAYFSVTNIKPQ